MEIIATHSFNNGAAHIDKYHPDSLKEIKDVISKVNAEKCRTKKSKEKRHFDRMIFSPNDLNESYKKELIKREWESSIKTQYQLEISGNVHNYKRTWDMDFKKEGLGLEVQFGKYAFMLYDVFVKMPIFAKEVIIDAGIELVPIYNMAYNNMSSGVSHFEMLVGDMEKRGPSSLDIPILVIGVDTKH